MEGEQNKPTDNTSSASPPSTKEDSPHSLKVETDSEPSNSPKKQKKTEEIVSKPVNNSKHYQDTSFTGYCSFSSNNKKPSQSTQSNAIQQILNLTPHQDSDEDDQQKKIAAAKKLLFPDALATSFPEVVDTLRSERRQEFCPIYKDETLEQTVLRQSKQKPVGSLLAKRIRWDDLKRKREEEDKKAQMQYHYGPYGPVHTNQQSFANPYEQYYTAMHNQYEQMIQMSRTQQEHSGFWPEYRQQSSLQNNDLNAQNAMQQQMQPYTYPYPAMYSNHVTGMNASSYSSADYNAYLNSIMQPPPPPPDEPYPY